MRFEVALDSIGAWYNGSINGGRYWGAFDNSSSFMWKYTHNANITTRSRNCIFYIFNETRDINDQTIEPFITNSTRQEANRPSYKLAWPIDIGWQGVYVLAGLGNALSSNEVFDLTKLCQGYDHSSAAPQNGNLLLVLLGGRDTLQTPEVLEDKIRETVANFFFNRRSSGTIMNTTCTHCSYQTVYCINPKLILMFVVLSVFFLFTCIYSVGVEGVWRGRDYMIVSLKMRNWISKVEEINEPTNLDETELVQKYGHIQI